ncbi:phage/plasmid replication domain-containing protein [Clostridium hydrogenum]|uniref:phage/plasmid replication domain-containing protein n=1 Tax=Clostridium hydrogenum TaxID=2855764 RepID=UPI001F450C6A|nr:phage/plasmid replication protein [Clostridium hydrogenum]
MIHTIQLYVALNNKNIDYITKKFNKNIKFVTDDIDNMFMACKSTITKKYNIWSLYIVIDIIKVLGTPKFHELDYPRVQNYIEGYMNQYGLNFSDATLIRVDYRLDVCIPNKKEREILFKIYKKAIEKYGFKKKYSCFKTTVYFNTRSTQTTAYDKEQERISNGKNICSYEKNVIRFEFRIQNRHLNNKKHKQGVDKKLINYFNNKSYLEYMHKNFEAILYKGDYYKIYRAETIINRSNLSIKYKKMMREFLSDVSIHGITYVKNKLNQDGKLVYSKYQFNNIIKLLSKLNINPILIPKNIEAPSVIINPFTENIFTNVA